MTISRSQRETILARIEKLVAEKYFDPNFDDSVWNGIVDQHRAAIVDAETEKAFETSVATMLAEMAPSPLALLSDRTLITPPNAINASFSVRTVDGQANGFSWIFFLGELPRERVSKLAMFSCRLAVSLSIHLYPKVRPQVLKCNKASKLLFCAVILARN
jgi:hypothetical protein